MVDRRVPSAYANIALAIAAANDDDRILLELAGSPFTGANNRGLTTNKRLIIAGEEAGIEVDLEETDGFCVVNLGGPLLDSFVVKDILFKKGKANSVLQFYSVIDLLIEDCVFNENESSIPGAALFTVGCGGLVNRCDFNQNSCSSIGGAAFIGGSTGTITFRHSTFFDNSTSAQGGAFVASSGTLIKLENCLFDYNYAVLNGGAFTSSAVDTDMNFCTFVRNRTSQEGGAIYLLDGISVDYNIDDCIIWGNSSALRSGNQIYIGNPVTSLVNLQNTLYENGHIEDIHGTFASEIESLTADPLFISSTDFHLRQPPAQAQTSPAVDTSSTNAVGSIVEGKTTRSDEYNDDGKADRGYHFVGNGLEPLAGSIDAESTVEGRVEVPFRNYLEVPFEAPGLTIDGEE
jgi:hypothetical protein